MPANSAVLGLLGNVRFWQILLQNSDKMCRHATLESDWWFS